MITFTLEDKEAAFVVQVIGQLPIQSGATLLFQKIQQQFALITSTESAEPTLPQE